MAELVTLALVLSGSLLVVVGLGAVLGGILVLSGGRVGRCPRCHRVGFDLGAGVHPVGCPEHLTALHAHALALGGHLHHR